MIRERSKEEKASLAARMLSSWEKCPRHQIVVTEHDHDMLLFSLAPIRVIVDKEREEILYVVHNKDKAVAHLRKEYSLYHVRDMSVCRDTP